jgi:hypothetical protein
VWGSAARGLARARSRSTRSKTRHAQSEPFFQEADQWKSARGETCLMMRAGDGGEALREDDRGGGERERKGTGKEQPYAAKMGPRKKEKGKRNLPKRRRKAKLWLVVGGKWAGIWEWAQWGGIMVVRNQHPCGFWRGPLSPIQRQLPHDMQPRTKPLATRRPERGPSPTRSAATGSATCASPRTVAV